MKIKYLGTGAFEGVPALGCNCEVCKKSRQLGGRNIRSRTQALVNGDLLIDFPPDTFMHCAYQNLDLCDIKNVLITHSHSDHLYVSDIESFKERYTHFYRDKPLCFYSGKSGFKKINQLIKREKMFNQAKAILIKKNEEFFIKDYFIKTIQAKHDKDSTPLLFRIEKDGKSLLYGNDSGYFSDEMINELKNYKPLNLISLDCTVKTCNYETGRHMCYEAAIKLLKILLQENIINENTIKVLNHFSHNNGLTYDEQSKIAEKDNVIIAYDGLELEF